MNYDNFLQYFSIGTLCVLFGLMTLGGYVSSTGVGLSCPQWPLCPQGLVPSYEFLIEYIHRTVAATTGLLVFLTMAFVLRGNNSLKSTKISSIVAAASVIGQITLGAIVINEKLHADLVTAHLGLGLILFSSMIFVVINIFYTNINLKSLKTSNVSSRDNNSNVKFSHK
ncbi:MAG TPA: COX15/CtaA family protein [Candidatus Saccharimonadales bacterium]|nr:COX15/CtaA family protein [Candidatus Saccharimonadales bacterium]